MKTYSPKPNEINRQWFLVDAKGKTLGRLATELAKRLRGKHKPEFAPHLDCGDFIVVINAEQVHTTGRKLEQKKYYWHTGYPGGIKSKTLSQMLAQKPEQVIMKAVKGMLPKNRLGRKLLKKLKVYAGDQHPHQAQQPKPLEI